MELTLAEEAAPEPSPVTPLESLMALATDPASRATFSPLGAQPYMLVDVWSAGLAPAEAQALAAWLGERACPVIGIAGPNGGDPLAQACDVIVPTLEAAWPLVASIRRTPVAAATLVQTLRATAGLALEAALTVESLAYATLQAGAEFGAWLARNRGTFRTPPDEDGPPVVLARDGGQLALTLNRPAARNSITVAMRDALVEALQLVAADASIETATLAGAGRCFSTGGELAEFGRVPDPATGHAVRSLALPGRLIAACGPRIEARVHGACIGAGIEMPAFAGTVVAAADTYFQLPELRFGLIPGAGGCVSVARRIGRQRTAWMVLSGKRIDARRAHEWGLVDAIG